MRAPLRRLMVPVVVSVLLLALSHRASAQNWSFDARDVALGGVGGSGNLATKMIDEQREYFSIVLPFGLLQVLSNTKIFDPNSPEFDPVRAAEYAASPLHYVVGRNGTNAGQAAFVNDIRNATLSRDLSKYKGFSPANDLLAEGLAAPTFGGTIKIRKGARGSFQGLYIGGGPYLSMHAAGTIDPALTAVLSSGVNARNARFPITNNDEVQTAVALTGGYRARFAWPSSAGSTSDRDGLYLAVNYDYLRGFEYGQIDMSIRLDTDNAGLITLAPSTTPIVITRREAKAGTGSAVDLGIGAVVGPWELGFGARGIANRINWRDLKQTVYSLDSLTSGNSDFRESATVALGDTRVELPVDYRANLAYATDRWTAAAEVGHGFGGDSFHGGYERRLGRIELRGGARYTTKKWNPTGGVGLDLSRRLSLDVAAFGTNTNIARTRQTAVAVSLRFNHRR